FYLHLTAPPPFSTLSLHDALPISSSVILLAARRWPSGEGTTCPSATPPSAPTGGASLSRSRALKSRSTMTARSRTAASSPTASRSEEHTSELQSPYDLVCRLLLEK